MRYVLFFPLFLIQNAFAVDSVQINSLNCQHYLTPSSEDPWDILTSADANYSCGYIEEAAKLYKSIPKERAASLDAKLRLFEMQGSGTLEESEFLSAGRTDLLPKVLLLLAKTFPEQRNDLLLKIRRDFATSNEANTARELLANIPLKDEPQVIAKEGDLELLEELVRKDKSIEAKQLLLEALLKREKLTKLKKLASTGIPEAIVFASEVMWRNNNPSAALKFLNLYKKKAGDSKAIAKADYVIGRIMLEGGKLNLAANFFKGALKRNEQTKYAYWSGITNFLVNNKADAINSFKKLSSLTEKDITQKNYAEFSVKELREFEASSYYWLGELNSNIKTNCNILRSEFLMSYYQLQAENNGWCPEVKSESNCEIKYPEITYLSRYLDNEEYFKKELGWTVRSIEGDNLRRLAKSEILQKFELFRPSISETEKVLSSAGYWGEIPQTNCLDTIIKLAFPLPYKDAILAAGDSNSLPASLIFGIARTESHFDKDARSPKDARGLMQLLVSTARSIGLGSDESLFNPEVNVKLGTLYLALLFSETGNNLPYTIASYNAGKGNLKKWLKRFSVSNNELWIEFIPFPETKTYVKRVLRAKMIYEKLLSTKKS